jgi:hypothetical protein
MSRLRMGIMGVGRAAGASLIFREPNPNLITNPEAINLWTLSACTVTANAIADPDGNMTGELVTDTNLGTSGAVVVQPPAITFAASANYRASVYMKPGASNPCPWFVIQVINITGLVLNAYFNTATGAAGSRGSGTTASGSDAAVNGWYRCWFTFTSSATDLAGNFNAGMASASGTSTVLRDSKTMNLFLGQLALV